MKHCNILIMLLCMLCACTKADAVSSESQSTSSMPQITACITPTADTASIRNITLAFTGDIMMGTTYPTEGSFLPANEGADLFKDVRDVISNADIAAGNLEGTLLDSEGIVKKCGNPELCYAFRMPTRYASHLTDAGFDFMSIANNHINDFGAPGLSSTQQTLKDAGIYFAGLRASCPTAILEKDGRTIGFAAFGHNRGTLNIMNMEEIRNTIQNLADKCDFVIVSFHGGGEGKKFTHVPHAMEQCFGEQRGNVEEFAHAAIDAGADVVYGHGPHVTRAIELYNDRIIMYSLGNFCTPYRVNLSGVSGHAPVVTVTLNQDGTFHSGRIYSFIQTPGTGPRTDTSHSVAGQMRTLTQSDFPSTPLNIANDGSISRK